MSHLIQRSLLLAIGLGITVSSTGCMTTPGDGEHVGNIESSVDFTGYITQPNAWVRIQAKHPDGFWSTIGWAKSAAWDIEHDGTDWNYWNSSVTIPLQFWEFEGLDNPEGQFSAEVRAVEYSSGNSLYTFEAGFNNWFDVNQSVADMYSDHGAGKSVKIYGNAYIE